MKKVGIIAEYNPFHNGHLYHLNEAKKLFDDASFILILIGNFTQRGEASIINKWDKTKIALDYGYDLVVELPFNISTSSADIYALGAIKILDMLKCDYLVFGSETNDIKLFNDLVNITKDNITYESKIKYYLDMGYNYPKSCSLALKDVSNIMVDKPNDVLALEYVRSIINLNSNIVPISIKRTNEYNDITIKDNIASASYIRDNIDDINLIKDLLPSLSLSYINEINNNKMFDLLKYEIIINENLTDILDVNDEIKNKLKKEIFNVSNIDELIKKIKTKRYSYNRLRRMLLHILTNTKKDYNTDINYIRVLGFTSVGTKILKEVKKDINVPIITKFKKEYSNLFNDDIKASKIYSLISNYDLKRDFLSSIKK